MLLFGGGAADLQNDCSKENISALMLPPPIGQYRCYLQLFGVLHSLISWVAEHKPPQIDRRHDGSQMSAGTLCCQISSPLHSGQVYVMLEETCRKQE